MTFDSTIFLLQEYQWRVNSNNMSHVPNIVSATDTWDETLSSLDSIATTCEGFRDQMVDTTSVLVATPFLAHVAYQAALFLIRMGQGAPDSIAAGRISLFKDLLQDIATRWKMASMYITRGFSSYTMIFELADCISRRLLEYLGGARNHDGFRSHVRPSAFEVFS